ncbi:hypothetical protein G3O06_01655 [Burkholderia sp. Ac-20345]|uniref:hypothetical protein n=1 Tax=Burkholderia sp. Ac-20345 TaxID=2703891 RepID=UPI00197B981B|nr:hypothetical protein [Burkholderia sp. Ac-20345]MBN3776267.1 hypothetical protein [Burkholderia sp. Ac-20345]
MGKASRRKADLKRLIELDQRSPGPKGAAKTSSEAFPDGLPLDFVDLLRSVNHPMFQFAEVDLARMRESDETPEKIFPPNGTCAEDDFVQAWIMAMANRPQENPWVFDPRLLEAASLNALRQYRCVVSFLHGGSKTYYFSAGLTESLSYTALNMPAPALKLPVPGFVFVFRSDAASEAFHAMIGTPIDRVHTITVFVREDTLKEFGFRRLLIVAYEHEDHWGGSSNGISRQLAMKDDWDLEQALNTDWDKPDMRGTANVSTTNIGWSKAPDGSLVPEDGAVERFLDEKVRFIRMVVNGILYVTSRGAEITELLAPRPIHAGGHRDHKSPTGSSSSRPYSLVGESIKHIPIVIDPTVHYDPSSLGSKRAVKVRFLVPGFWRRPPNSSPDAKKDVWVSAHYRGPEIADLVNNPYIVR